MVRVGARNVRGVLEGPVKTTHASGQVVSTFGPLTRTPVEWAEVRPLRGMEYLRAEQVFGETMARLRFRYRDDLTEEMRFVTDRGDVWDFQSPPFDPDGRRTELETMAVRRA